MEDRLYFNDGQGKFNRKQEALPPMKGLEGCVKAADYDGDGDQDLFVGGRVVPGQYPRSPRSYLLINENGKFKDGTKAAGLPEAPGMISDALWTDFNQDGHLDFFATWKSFGGNQWRHLYLYDAQGKTYKPVKLFEYFFNAKPVPELPGAYYSYEGMYCDGAVWNSQLFVIEDFEAIMKARINANSRSSR